MQIVPIKQYTFSIEIDGLVQFTAQEITTPDWETEEVEHGEGVVIVRTPGMVKFGDLTVKKLIASDTADTWARDWITQVNNPQTNVGSATTLFLKTCVIRMKDAQGAVKKTWEYKDCWMKKKSGVDLSRTSSDNVIEECVIAVNGINEF